MASLNTLLASAAEVELLTLPHSLPLSSELRPLVPNAENPLNPVTTFAHPQLASPSRYRPSSVASTSVPTKKCYITACTGAILLSALAISAIALLIVHHGSLSSQSLLHDELDVLPKVCGGIVAAAVMTVAAGYVLYRKRYQKHAQAELVAYNSQHHGDL